MIGAFLYQYIYLFIVTVYTMIFRTRYKYGEAYYLDRGKLDEGKCIFLVVVLSLFIGFRPPTGVYFGDTANYLHSYLLLEGQYFQLDITHSDPIFSNLFAWWASNELGWDTLFVFIDFIYFGCTYLGVRKLFPEHKLVAYITFLGAFSTFSYATNGIRAGAAAAIFIWAISYWKNLWVCVPLMLISLGTHHSMQLPIVAYVLVRIFKNPRLYFAAWFLCMFMAFAHISFFANLFAGMSDESGAGYLSGSGNGGEDGTKGGFRLDFIIYSAMPVLVGFYMVFVKVKELSQTYSMLLRLYLCTNGVWMLCMYANFTNRIAYLSWFLYPIVLIYPFLFEEWGDRDYERFAKYMLYHLGFTLFMALVYYG